MAVNHDEEGKSVYLSESREVHEAKSENPLYKTVKEMVEKALPDKKGLVIDLGCSDLVATGPLIERGYSVVGLELDPTALRKAKEFYPDAMVFIADINAIPLAVEGQTPKVILMLDILEHLDRSEAIKVLQELGARMGNHKLIVSMPNISPYSAFALAESLAYKIKGERPEKGLFDRSHRILTDIDGHKRLFKEGGYTVKEQYVRTWDTGVSGDWKWKSSNGHHQTAIHRAYGLLARQAGARVVSLVENIAREDAEDLVTGYQGIYLLEPLTNEHE